MELLGLLSVFITGSRKSNLPQKKLQMQHQLYKKWSFRDTKWEGFNLIFFNDFISNKALSNVIRPEDFDKFLCL